MADGSYTIALHEARGELAGLLIDLFELGKPTIAKVRGFALAGGFGLALACDFVVASPDSQFGTPEIDVGLWPFMITVPLVRSMPPKLALELMMTGRRTDATEAGKHRVRTGGTPPTISTPRSVCSPKHSQSKSAAVMKLGRDAFYAAWVQSAADALRLLHPMLTMVNQLEDAAEGMTAFREKRPPIWRDR